jgi:HlyD family secretion protein/epimerase transport system membrane fusion protein
VSADRILDPVTHQPYYLARVTVSRDLLRRLAPHVELIPGMPAEVLIVTEHRTLIDYLSKPFRDAFWRSFRET